MRKSQEVHISETLRQLVDEGEGIFTKGMGYGLIDKKGNIVLFFRYQHLSDLHGGKMFAHSAAYANGAISNDLGIINDKGEWLVLWRRSFDGLETKHLTLYGAIDKCKK